MSPPLPRDSVQNSGIEMEWTRKFKTKSCPSLGGGAVSLWSTFVQLQGLRALSDLPPPPVSSPLFSTAPFSFQTSTCLDVPALSLTQALLYLHVLPEWPCRNTDGDQAAHPTLLPANLRDIPKLSVVDQTQLQRAFLKYSPPFVFLFSINGCSICAFAWTKTLGCSLDVSPFISSYQSLSSLLWNRSKVRPLPIASTTSTLIQFLHYFPSGLLTALPIGLPSQILSLLLSGHVTL